MTVPDGHTENIHQAAAWARGSWVLWCVAMLVTVMTGLIGPGLLLQLASLLPLAWGIWIATRPSRSGRGLSLRRVVRLIVLLAVAATLTTPLLGGGVLFVVAWGTLPVAFWAFCGQLVHRGSPLRRRIRQLVVGWVVLDALTAIAVLPFVLGGLSGGLTSSIFGLALLTWMLGATALWYISSRVMRAFGEQGLAEHTDLAEYVETGALRRGEAWLAFAKQRGLQCEASEDGLDITGTMHRRQVRVRIWSAVVPASMEITIEAPALRGLTVAARGTLDSTTRTGDPLLDRLLDVSADDVGLLKGLHEPLMETFHAHPTARLHSGRLTMKSGAASTLEAAPFLRGAVALLEALEARLDKQSQRQMVQRVQ